MYKNFKAASVTIARRKEYLLNNCIYMKFQEKQNQNLETMSTVITFRVGGDGNELEKECMETFWDSGNKA